MLRFAANLIGRHFGHASVEASSKYYPYELRQSEGREGYGIVLKNSTGEFFLTGEEAVAMVLEHCKEAAEAFADATIRDAVITVPPYWTHHERRALVWAAKMAKINVLSVLNEPTAVALHYAVSRKLEDSETVLFFDMGESTTKASIVSFSKYLDEKNKTVPQLQVLATKWDTSLGARDFDYGLLHYFAEQINADPASHKYTKGDVRKNKRAMGKLAKETRRIKEVLSANTETIAQIDGIVGEYDLRAKVSRDKFEELNAQHWPKLAALAREVLEAAEIKVSDLTGLEVVGGGVRMPKAYETLREFYGKESLDRHLNGDEAACQGAAFYGVIKSIAFRTQNIKVRDVNLNSVSIDVLSGLQAESKVIFSEDSMYDFKKVLTFRTENDTVLQLRYDDPSKLPPSTPALIGMYNVTGMPSREDFNFTNPPRVSVTFVLENGIVSVEKAEVTFKYSTTERITKKVKKLEKEKKEKDGEESKEEKKEEKEEQKKEEKEEKKVEEKEVEKKEEKKEGEEVKVEKGDRKNVTKEEDLYEEVVVVKPVNRTKKMELRVTFTALGVTDFNETQLREIRDRYRHINELEEVRIKTLKALNELESFSYSIPDTVEDESFSKSSTPFEREQLKEMASNNLEWLEEDGSSATLEELQKRLRNMTREVDRVKYRISENKAFPEALKSCRSLINITTILMENITQRLEVTEEELNDTLGEVERLSAFLDEKEKEREGVAPHEDPKTSSTLIEGRCSVLNSMSRRLLNRKRKVAKKPPKIKKTSNSTDTNSTDSSGGEKKTIKEVKIETEEKKEDKKKEGGKEEKVEEKDEKKPSNEDIIN